VDVEEGDPLWWCCNQMPRPTAMRRASDGRSAVTPSP